MSALGDGPLNCTVLGANGFLGSHLVDALVDAGHRVTAFDRFSRRPQFQQHESLRVLAGDLTNGVDVDGALAGAQVVFHCVASSTPFTADADPSADVEASLLQDVGLFEACVRAGVAKVVFLSSGGAVYGAAAEGAPAGEDDVPVPVSPYGICKLASEHYLSYFRRKHGMDHTIYRVANPYGPRQRVARNQGVVPAFISRIVDGQPVVVMGDGRSSRDYIHVHDAIAMIVRSFARSDHRTYNIASGTPTSLNDLLAALEVVIGHPAERVQVPEPASFAEHTQLRIDRFVAEFGAPPLRSLLDGLRDAVATYTADAATPDGSGPRIGEIGSSR